ncbi:hypothetical protein [Polaribacter glomeratus]|uniref:hypothetical protein n=1 Tax=Polaribacter glomeratus TaxID=102 RepID=UPI001474F644|nr:hypothetical protein [Polaribacter glomeratus]
MDIKAPGENWIGKRRYKNDISTTVYNSEKREKALEEIKYLVANYKYLGKLK